MTARWKVLCISLLLALSGTGCSSTQAPPVAGTPSPAASPSAAAVNPELLKLREATQQHPDDPAAWLALGQALFYQASDEEARQALQKASELSPKDPAVWRLRLQVALNTRDEAQIVETASKLLELAPDDPDALDTLAWQYGFVESEKAAPAERVELYKKAMPLYERMEAANKAAGRPTVLVVFRMGQLYQKLYEADKDPQDKAKAVALYKRFLAENPTHPLSQKVKADLTALGD